MSTMNAGGTISTTAACAKKAALVRHAPLASGSTSVMA
jgi:hypothetical protein